MRVVCLTLVVCAAAFGQRPSVVVSPPPAGYKPKTDVTLSPTATEAVRVSVARARLLEWRRRDPQKALDVVEDAQRRMPEIAPELEHRRARLRRKVELRSREGSMCRRDGGQRNLRQIQLEAPILDGAG